MNDREQSPPKQPDGRPAISAVVADSRGEVYTASVYIHAVPAISAVLKKLATPVLLLWLALATIPPPPNPVGTGVDAAWRYGLNLAQSGHLRPGKDVVFTYGPLGFLSEPDPDLAPWFEVWSFNAAIYGLFVFALFRCGQSIRNGPVRLLTVLVLAITFILTLSAADRLQVAFLSLALSAVANICRTRVLELSILGAFAGIELLVKLNDGVAATLIFYTILGAFLWYGKEKRWRFGTIAVLTPLIVAFVGFAVVSGSPSLLGLYLQNAWEITSGYSEAMSLNGPAWQLALAVLGSLALFLAFPFVCAEPRSIIPGFLPALLACFFLFKHAMVRQDWGHADFFHFDLACCSLFLLVSLSRRRERLILTGFCVASCVTGLAILGNDAPGFLLKAERKLMMCELTTDASPWLHFQQTMESNGAVDRKALSPEVADPEISQMIGSATIDDIPNGVDRVKANGWRWDPRPVFQSYSAYTARLDWMNAAHLSGPDAPRFIVLEWQPIDGRQPLLDDSRSWRTLLDRYDLHVVRPDFFLLQRRQIPRYEPPKPLGAEVGYSWDRTIGVPLVGNGGLLMMRAEIHRSLWGVLRGFLYRVEPIFVDATYSSGKRVRFRVTRPNIADGAFLYPLPTNLQELRPYFGSFPPGLHDQLTTIQWHADHPGEFSAQIRLSWYSVAFRSGEINTSALLEPPPISLRPIWKPPEPVASVTQATMQQFPTFLAVIPNNIDSQVHIESATELNRYNTIVIRARFSVADKINLFFGREVDGRGFEGNVPRARQWLDVYVNVGANRFWVPDAGRKLRFDPGSEGSVGAKVEIAGVWGAAEKPFSGDEQMIFYPAVRE